MAGEQNTHVVPMPAFTDPNLPEAAGGSVNFGAPGQADFEDHPVKHSDDYGAAVLPVDFGDDSESDGRSDWLKADWIKQANDYGLDSSGTVAELKALIEEHEKTLAADNG